MGSLCPFCDEYARNGHNYCRMCGSHLSPGREPRPEVPIIFEPAEKYCGHCGRQWAECSGRHGGPALPVRGNRNERRR